ncbi:MAG: phage holin family protein [Oligoflexia bacterium]|nr:phage holin family protein [Oligoflexia bacterium]
MPTTLPPELLSIDFNYWILQTLAMMITAFLLPGLQVSGPIGALLTVVAMAFVNTKIWDAALFFAIPNHVSVQAVTLIIANGIIFWVLVKILPGIEVQGVLPALIAPVVFSICNILINQYGKDIDWQKATSVVLREVSEAKTTLQHQQPPTTPSAAPTRSQ